MKSEYKNKLKFGSAILDNKGQGLTEYITLLLLVSVLSIGVVKTLGTRIKDNIKQASSEIDKGLTLK